MWGAHEGMGWWMVIGTAWFLLFWGLVIWSIAAVVSKATGRDQGREASPLEIAKRRYARGEISKDEFEALKRDLA